MQNIIYDNTENETSRWNVTCHYDIYEDGKDPVSFMECMALFALEVKQGWDNDFKPLHMQQKEEARNGGVL